MADENTEGQVIEPTPIETPDTPPTPQYSEAEQRALEQGWVPEDQWTGSGKWRSAEEFLDRGELFSKIDEVKRRAERSEQALEALKKHHKVVKETEFKRALNYLKQEKIAALENGDHARAVEIDDEISEVKVAQQQAVQEFDQPQPEPQAPNPHVVAWMNRNSWYNTNKAMKVFADTVAQEIAMAGERNPTKILDEVERQVKKEFAEKFNNPNRDKPGVVEGGSNKGKSNARDTVQLTDEETQVMRKLVRHGVMTEKEYRDEIKATRGA